ncbi:MAG: YfaZ family protein [Gammaproteobacteria bacterium]|nr:YfaZ family protein [Gammaproteobacteria bacterium]
MLRSLIITIMVFVPVATVSADSLDVNFSNESVRAIYNLDRGTKDFSFGGLFVNPDQGSSATLLHAGLEVTGDGYSGDNVFEGRLGFRGYLLSTDTVDVSALAIGGQVKLFPQGSKVGFGINAFYAPEIVTGLDGDRFWEWGARLEFRLFETGTLYVGFREVQIRLEGSTRDVTIDDGGFIGLDIKF